MFHIRRATLLPAMLIFCVVGAVFVSTSTAAETPRKPNIIYILLDDAGYGDLSCYGQQKFATPHIDSLATEGIKYTDHYAGSTVCAPTRCSLMTGKHTGHCVVRGNREVRPEGQAPMPADIVTTPRLLKQAGYATGMFGKWGLGAPGSPSDPVEHFDVFYGYNCQRQAHNYYPTHLWDNDQKVELDGQQYAHNLIMEQMLKFVRDHQDQPFFCYVPVVIPHAAMQAPEENVAPFRKQFAEFENTIGNYGGAKVKNPVAAFPGMMTLLDSQVGQLLALLKELKIDDNTLVMLSSDNGPHKEGGHRPDIFNSNGPLRGHKRDLYEGGIRAPLLARWPGTIKPGQESALMSAHWDMLPTFCEIAGVKPPTDIDGISLLWDLQGTDPAAPQHEFLYWEFTERGKSQAVRMGNWKGVRVKLAANPNAPLELYNLKEDIGETKNIAADHPEIVKRLTQIMQQEHVPSKTFPLFK